ncbi:MAG: hypothetical protein ACQPRI_06485 [Solitalea-like symbiont of Tyrophagus putrescentiae]
MEQGGLRRQSIVFTFSAKNKQNQGKTSPKTEAEAVMKKTSVKKDGAKATEKATYASALKSSVPPPSAQKQKTAGKGVIGSQPKI